MFKIINILLFIGIIQTAMYAETTKEDVDKYMEVSRGGALIKHIFAFEYKDFFSIIYDYDISTADKITLAQYDKFILNHKYIDDVYDILSLWDDNTYYEIMEFYKTKIGNKYGQAFKNIYMDDTAEKLLELLEEKKEPLLKIKRPLVLEINKELNSSSLYIKLRKTSTIAYNSKALKKNRVSSMKQIDEFVKNKSLYLKEFVATFSEIAYKDFTNDELSKILEYAKTYGIVEMSLVYRLLELHKKNLYKDLNIFLKEKALKDKKLSSLKQSQLPL